MPATPLMGALSQKQSHSAPGPTLLSVLKKVRFCVSSITENEEHNKTLKKIEKIYS